ncbi:MAG: hypothetical protein MHM6MM_006297 [Cercozoa sp. M6MM]
MDDDLPHVGVPLPAGEYDAHSDVGNIMSDLADEDQWYFLVIDTYTCCAISNGP